MLILCVTVCYKVIRNLKFTSEAHSNLVWVKIKEQNAIWFVIKDVQFTGKSNGYRVVSVQLKRDKKWLSSFFFSSRDLCFLHMMFSARLCLLCWPWPLTSSVGFYGTTTEAKNLHKRNGQLIALVPLQIHTWPALIKRIKSDGATKSWPYWLQDKNL